jgi:hypothetical protein
VYSPEQVQQVVELFIGGAERDKLDPILDACVVAYRARLGEDGQVGQSIWESSPVLESRYFGRYFSGANLGIP